MSSENNNDAPFFNIGVWGDDNQNDDDAATESPPNVHAEMPEYFFQAPREEPGINIQVSDNRMVKFHELQRHNDREKAMNHIRRRAEAELTLTERLNRVGPNLNIDTEMRLARLSENVAYYSSCSEDEVVLEYTLKFLQKQTTRRLRAHARRRCIVRKNRGDNDDDDDDDDDDDADDATKTAARKQKTQAQKRAASFVTEDALYPADDEKEAAVTSSSSSNLSTNAPEYVISGRVYEELEKKVQQLRRLIEEERAKLKMPLFDTCFMCTYGDMRYDSLLAPELFELSKLLKKDMGRRSNQSIARDVHKFFKERIYKPMCNAGKLIPMWRTRSVFAHITEHDPDPRRTLRQDAERIHTVVQNLQDMAFVRHPDTGEICPDLKVLREAREQLKTMYAILNIDPAKLLLSAHRTSRAKLRKMTRTAAVQDRIK